MRLAIFLVPTLAEAWVWTRHGIAALSVRSAVVEQNTVTNQETKITSGYVTELFDSFADAFEDVLTELEYCAPGKVASAAGALVDGRGGSKYGSCLDAGCGTGWVGHNIRDLVTGDLVGVDLSPKMVEWAEELCYDKGSEAPPTRADASVRKQTGWPPVYEAVYAGNLLQLDALPLAKTFDLVVAADVLCYFGDLEAVLAALSERTAPGGDLIFSVETLPEGEWSWVLQCQERYAHHPDYVERVARSVGLEALGRESFQPRTESGYPVRGTLHTFRKPLGPA